MSDELLEKLKRIRDLMGHKDISSYEKLLNAMADVVLKKIDPAQKTERVATSGAEREPSPDTTKKRFIPAKVRRRVWREANYKCEKCGGTFALEVDHKIPFSKAGNSEQENLRLLCRSCNQREAIIKIGREQMSFFLD